MQQRIRLGQEKRRKRFLTDHCRGVDKEGCSTAKDIEKKMLKEKKRVDRKFDLKEKRKNSDGGKDNKLKRKGNLSKDSTKKKRKIN